MEGQQRREEIIRILRDSSEPVSGAALSRQLEVSRQVIVQDIALLRASDVNILSAARGYVLSGRDRNAVRCFQVCHTTDQIEDELNTIVDCGGKVMDVIIDHDVYGTISAGLVIGNRMEVREFVQRLKSTEDRPLKELSGGLHFHTVQAQSEEILDYIEVQLIKKGYLAE